LLNSYGRGPKSPGRVTSDATTTTNEYRTNAGGSVVGGDYIHGRAVPTRRNTEEKRRPENTVVTNNNSIQIRRRLGSRTFGPLIITVANRGRFPTSLTARAGIRPPPLYTHTHTHSSSDVRFVIRRYAHGCVCVCVYGGEGEIFSGDFSPSEIHGRCTTDRRYASTRYYITIIHDVRGTLRTYTKRIVVHACICMCMMTGEGGGTVYTTRPRIPTTSVGARAYCRVSCA